MATVAALKNKFPWQSFRKAWQQGVATMYIPTDYIGPNDPLHIQAWKEDLSAIPNPLKQALNGHHSVQISLAHGAKKSLQDRYFPLMMRLPVVAAAPLPSQPTSTPGVTFEVKGKQVILQGRQIPYQNAEVASMFLIDAHDKSDPDGSRSLFLVDKHALGIDVQTSHGHDHVSTPVVCFHNVIIPKSNMIGQFGDAIRLTDLTQKLLQKRV